jgi:hypothetical protein
MAPALSTPQKRKASANVCPPAVTDWVTIHLPKALKQKDKILKTTPCVVSSVDVEKGTVNVLYPNAISVFFQRQSRERRLLFAIQTHPLAAARSWEGDRKHLDSLMQQALLQFAEQRGVAVKNGEMLRVESELAPTEIDERTSQVQWSAEAAASDIQKDLSDHIAEQLGDTSTSKADVQAKAEVQAENAPSTPIKAKSGNVNSVTSSALGKGDQGELAHDPPVAQARPARPTPAGDLKSFTRELARLFGGAASLPKVAIQSALAAAFPDWENFLNSLDDMNKVLLAEDAVFRI